MNCCLQWGARRDWLKILRGISLMSIGLVIAMQLSSCAPELGEEQQIAATMGNMETALEEHELAPFINHISADFSANNIDKRALRWIVQHQWFTHQKIMLQLADVDIQLTKEFDPPRATVTFDVLASGGDWLPRNAGWYRFETGWRKDGGSWRAVSAQWRRKL